MLRERLKQVYFEKLRCPLKERFLALIRTQANSPEENKVHHL